MGSVFCSGKGQQKKSLGQSHFESDWVPRKVASTAGGLKCAVPGRSIGNSSTGANIFPAGNRYAIFVKGNQEENLWVFAEEIGFCFLGGNWLLLPGWYTRKPYSDTSHRHRLAYRSSRSGQIPPRFEPMSSRSYPLHDTSNRIPPVRAGASRRQEGLRFVFSSSDTPLFHVRQIDIRGKPHVIDGKPELPHTHKDYEHNEKGNAKPSPKEKMIERVLKIWYNRHSR